MQVLHKYRLLPPAEGVVVVVIANIIIIIINGAIVVFVVVTALVGNELQSVEALRNRKAVS